MKLWQGWHRQRKFLVIFRLSWLARRSLPYLTPIRARDLHQDERAKCALAKDFSWEQSSIS